MIFTIEDLTAQEKSMMLDCAVWAPECPVPIHRLKAVHVSHYDFSKHTKTGRVVVLDLVANNVLEIFKELYSVKFPIASLKPMEEYSGNDELSMSDNNSSGFNYRVIAGKSKLSMHAYGLAIDINPAQNPYICFYGSDEEKIEPLDSMAFLDRTEIKPGMLEPVVHIFAKYGFSQWGGDWSEPVDYHHFQIPRELVDSIRF